MKDRLIGEILLEKSIVTAEQLKLALDVQKEKGGYLCSIIIELRFAQPQEVLKILSCQLNVPYFELENTKIDEKVIEKVPVRIALYYKLMPYKFENGELSVVLEDPLNIHKLDDLRLLLDTDILVYLSYKKDILDTIQKYYGVGADILDEIMARPDVEKKIKGRASIIKDLESSGDDASIVKFVNQIFTQAVEDSVTDIHIEPFENETKIRFRIDGFLYEVPIPESIKLFHQSIISRIKILSNLDIAEHRLPQDGRMAIRIKGEEIEFRVSILPSYFGESVQIRILSKKSFLDSANLGLSEEALKKVEFLVDKPHGIVFVTGPTGSGKTTSLYAFLNKKNRSEVKIITTEDPVEYQIRGIIQIPIHTKIGLTFAEGLRSILRHDPDIIMVGEVRDPETAEITIRSSMTGHLVFSTLHTNDASSAPTRLIDMGIEPFLVASSIEGIIAQRLVRVLCPKCKNKVKVKSSFFNEEDFNIKEDIIEVFESKGCPDCRFTGFRGRTAIFEILVVNDEIRGLIFERVTSQVIKKKALSYGMETLRKDGLRKVLNGITTLSEVMRVT